MTDQEYEEKMDAIHAASAVRRAAAWAPVPFRVLGQPFRPLTPATFTLMVGTENGFVCGTEPTLADVKNFLRFHHPKFDPDNPAPGRFRRVGVVFDVARMLYRPIRGDKAANLAQRLCANFLTAAQQIREHIDEAWADSLPGNSEAQDSGPVVAASTMASLLDAFAREYRYWPFPQPFRHTPIAQLLQMARCIDRHHGGTAAGYFDRAAWRLTAEYLRAANAPDMVAARKQDAATNVRRQPEGRN